MSSSCPVGADVCREAHAELERLRKEMHLRELHHFEVEFEAERLRRLAIWLTRLDGPDGIEERRTVTLTKIIDRARVALDEGGAS